MAITNPNRIITVSMLSDFFNKLKSSVLSLYYKKTEADNTFASKNGSLANNFSVRKLNFSGDYNVETVAEMSCNSEGTAIRFIAYSSGASRQVTIPLNKGQLLNGILNFDINKQVSVFKFPSGNVSYLSYNSTAKAIECSGLTNDTNTIVFVNGSVCQDSDNAVSNPRGFYLLQIDDDSQTLDYLCPPDKYSLYYGNFDGDNPTTNYLCRWDGAQFQAIATGGGGSIDGDYTLAEESDINDILNTDPIDE